MKYQASKLITTLTVAFSFVIAVVQPACVGIWHEPKMPSDLK